MEDERLMAYFQQRGRDTGLECPAEADELWERLTKREPSDEEILRRLSISTSSDQWPQGGFAAPFGALSMLSEAERVSVCREFRLLLNSISKYQ
jgi:hypothetical protein